MAGRPYSRIWSADGDNGMRIGIAAGHSERCKGEMLWEHERCREAAWELECLLIMGSDYEVISSRPFWQRPNATALKAKVGRFNTEKADLAIELHLNAGGGDYSLVLHHRTSTAGARLAMCVSTQFKAAFPWRQMPADSGHGFTGRKLAFLTNTHMPAIITEPGFMDCPEHRELMESPAFPARYAAAVYLGIERYLDEL